MTPDANADPHQAELRTDARGAAAVEFVLVMVPVFLCFFCFLQVGKLYMANLVFQHAATVAARAAAVIVEPSLNPGENGSEDDVKTVARLALGAWQTAIRNVDVSVSSAASTSDPNGLVTAKLTGKFHCGVAMAARLTCGSDKSINLKATARFPLQGARYRMGSGTSSQTPVGDLAGAPAKSVCDPNSPFDVCSR